LALATVPYSEHFSRRRGRRLELDYQEPHMGRIEKTIFISYRRTNLPWALAIYQNLTAKGFDVFFDYQSINSGDFEQIILKNIRARAHFLVLLTPSALERGNDSDDWLRREIETALDEKRNIVPLFLEGFDFGSPSITKYLTGKLAFLKNYNGLNVPADYFDEAMKRLQTRFLNVPLDAVLHPVSNEVQKAVQKQQNAANKATPIEEKELTAQEWFENGITKSHPDEKIYCYTQAILLKPDYAYAYNNRGSARSKKGDLDGAIKDYNEAIRFKPEKADFYHNRGLTRSQKGDLEGAIEDYNEAIRLESYVNAYNDRGNARSKKGDLDGAIKDYNEAIRLRSYDASAYNNRGTAHFKKGDFDNAIRDFEKAIRLKPDLAPAYLNHGAVHLKKGDFDNAIKDFEKAIQIKPDYTLAKGNLKIAWSRKK
jgi:tetratricopeptide (TPR) repeat protein